MKMKTRIMLLCMLAMVGCVSTAWRGTAIQDRLSRTPGLGTHDISIDERTGGVISLNGTVSSDADRDEIERIARRTKGVREVRNNLVVVPSSVVVREGNMSGSNDASAIVSEIMSRMRASSELRDYHVNVEVVGDTAILRGEVGNERERDAAERIALNTRGITRVRNDIELASRPSDLQISRDVRDELLRSNYVDLRDVDITTRDGVVTFRGSQNSRRDIDHLLSVALTVKGVRDVRNELTLVGGNYNEHYRQSSSW